MKIAVKKTAGVLGDNIGLYLLKLSFSGTFSTLKRKVGCGLVIFSPFLMETLTIVGTIAMFLVYIAGVIVLPLVTGVLDLKKRIKTND